MSEMVESVAKAMAEQGQAHTKWEDCAETFREKMRAQARAAIEAMREPTPAMVDAGYEADNGEDRHLGERGARDCWRLMVDAALK